MIDNLALGLSHGLLLLVAWRLVTRPDVDADAAAAAPLFARWRSGARDKEENPGA
jgi:hypothetical protein